MLMLKSAFITSEDGMRDPGVEGYWIEETDDPMYLPGHAAAIYLKLSGKPKAQQIGSFGILHPEVLRRYDLPFVASTLELNVEVFL